MSDEVFDRCPNCRHRPTFGTTIVYQCSGFHRFCDKCLAGNFLLGYKCPTCTLHIRTGELPSLRIGTIPWIDQWALFAFIGSLSIFITLCFMIQMALPK
jgi:hypothetical protein